MLSEVVELRTSEEAVSKRLSEWASFSKITLAGYGPTKAGRWT